MADKGMAKGGEERSRAKSWGDHDKRVVRGGRREWEKRGGNG